MARKGFPAGAGLEGESPCAATILGHTSMVKTRQVRRKLGMRLVFIKIPFLACRLKKAREKFLWPFSTGTLLPFVHGRAGDVVKIPCLPKRIRPTSYNDDLDRLLGIEEDRYRDQCAWWKFEP